MTGKHGFNSVPTEGRYEGGAASRWGERWWKEELFQAVAELQAECEGKHSIPLAAAAIRWVAFHSALERKHGDAVILGASSLQQLASNAECVGGGALPEALVSFMDTLAEMPSVRGVVPAIGSKHMTL